MLELGSKHPFGDKRIETHFLVDIDIFLSDLNNEIPGDAFF